MNGIIYLEDGTVYQGCGFGFVGTSCGELVFNTSMSGYQEILTDPSYAGQIITMTYPLIGNYGVNRFENESRKIFARGMVVKTASNNPSNHLSEGTLHDFLVENRTVGVTGVDTRSITKKIRSHGTLKCVISNENKSVKELKRILENHDFTDTFVNEVSPKEIYNIPGKGKKVVVIDMGAKANIFENFKKRDCDLIVVPYNTTAEKIMSYNPDGVFLSNGPGDPKTAVETVAAVKQLIGQIPVFGICLGHQMIGLAMGADTYKLKFGHRGGNHGVLDLQRDKAYITSQNHGYSVDEESLKDKDLFVTHINLNDNTIEGLQHKHLPVYSVQFHPEGAPGPIDTEYLFDKFMDIMEKGRDVNAIR